MSEMSTEVLEVKPKKPQTEGTKLSKAKYYQKIKNNEAYKEQIKKMQRNIMKITKTTF
jgi:hypothetical protein